MRSAILLLGICSAAFLGERAAGQPTAPRTLQDPAIRRCSAAEQQYGTWALDFRRLLDRNSTDFGGSVDAGLIHDINYALIDARDFVHDNIQGIQRRGALGQKPSSHDCKRVVARAMGEITRYSETLLGGSARKPLTPRQRQLLRTELRNRLQGSTWLPPATNPRR